MKKYTLKAVDRKGELKGDIEIEQPETLSECITVAQNTFELTDDAADKKVVDIFWAGYKVAARQHFKLHGTPISKVAEKIANAKAEMYQKAVDSGAFATIEEAKKVMG